jgi:hypothetical protein
MKKRPLRRSSEGVDSIDQSKLRANGYAKNCENWDKVFVIRNMKYENKVAELRATSLIHACNLIGWRPRHVKLISVRDAGA